MRARRSSSPITLRAIERLACAAAIAALYAPREPPKRAATIERSAARISLYETCAVFCCPARANAFENASSGSPASFRIGLIADQRTAAVPSRQRRPGETISWPSVRDRLKPFPAAAGPLQSFGFLVHR